MGVGAGLYMYVVVVQKFTFAMSSPDEFLFTYNTVTQVCKRFEYTQRIIISLLCANLLPRNDDAVRVTSVTTLTSL